MKRDILIISDDIFLSQIARPMFEDIGFTVRAFETSKEGVDACFARTPDILIINYSSTGFPPDAFSVVSAIRRDTRTKNLPILMISAVEREARAVGVTDWVDVVFDVNDLIQKVVFLMR